MALNIKLPAPIINPDSLIIKGSAKTPEPIAVDIRANILPLIDPGVNYPNHFYQQFLFLASSIVILSSNIAVFSSPYTSAKIALFIKKSTSRLSFSLISLQDIKLKLFEYPLSFLSLSAFKCAKDELLIFYFVLLPVEFLRGVYEVSV